MGEVKKRVRLAPHKRWGDGRKKRAAGHPLNRLLDARQTFEYARRGLYARLAAFAAGQGSFDAVVESLGIYKQADADFLRAIDDLAAFDPASMPTTSIGELAKSLERISVAVKTD